MQFIENIEEKLLNVDLGMSHVKRMLRTLNDYNINVGCNKNHHHAELKPFTLMICEF